MKLLLNGVPVTVEGEIKTLESLVYKIKKEHIVSEYLITSILIDEKEIDISQKEFPVSDSSSIEVLSESPYRLADKSINNLKEHIDHTIPMLEKVSDKFRTQGEEEANKYYSECLSALQLFSELIDGVGQMLNLDYSKIKTENGNINDEITKTQKLFEAMHGAQKQKDWILLADIIEYELTPVMKNWIESFPVIHAYIQKQKE